MVGGFRGFGNQSLTGPKAPTAELAFSGLSALKHDRA